MGKRIADATVAHEGKTLIRATGCLLAAMLVLALGTLVGCSSADQTMTADGQSNSMGEQTESTDAASSAIQKVTAEEAHELMSSDNPIILDVRTQDEYNDAHIPDAQLLTLDTIDADTAAAVAPDKDAMVIVYCRTGVRSAEAAQKLADLGYTNIVDMGGITSWTYDTVSE